MPSRKKRTVASSSDKAPCPGELESHDIPPDPDWEDIASVPCPAERYTYFHPPRAYRDAMLGDAKHWARDVAPQTVIAITNVVSGICMPWWVDWSMWRRHTSDFSADYVNTDATHISNTVGISMS